MLLISLAICLLTTSCEPDEIEAFLDGYYYVNTGDSSVFDD